MMQILHYIMRKRNWIVRFLLALIKITEFFHEKEASMSYMNCMEDVAEIPEWFCFSSVEAAWEAEKILCMRGDFKRHATLEQGRGLPEKVQLKRWVNENPDRPDYRSHVELEVVEGNSFFSTKERFLLSRARAYLAYYAPVAF